jgi:pimeloyl-ACP methyl ester carboxylesterase
LIASVLIIACAAAPHAVTVPFAGSSLFVDDGGRGGVPIVFIHGNGGSTEQWRAQLAHFRSSGRRAVAIDLPGFGKSTAAANGDVSLEAMAAAIDGAVKAIHLDRFVIVGHSYGGAVVAKYAATHPEKVAGVVYLDAAATAVTLTQQQRDQFIAGLRADKMRVVRAWFAPMLKPSSDRVRDDVFASVERTAIDPFIGALISLGAYDPQTLVNAYHGPRLAIAASDIESPAAFQKQFPEIETVRIAGAGHWVMLDKPDEVNAALDGFLKKL